MKSAFHIFSFFLFTLDDPTHIFGDLNVDSQKCLVDDSPISDLFSILPSLDFIRVVQGNVVKLIVAECSQENNKFLHDYFIYHKIFTLIYFTLEIDMRGYLFQSIVVHFRDSWVICFDKFSHYIYILHNVWDCIFI